MLGMWSSANNYYLDIRKVIIMESALLEVATTQGIWVLLFVSLFIYTIRRYEGMEEKQEMREREYQKLLNDLVVDFLK